MADITATKKIGAKGVPTKFADAGDSATYAEIFGLRADARQSRMKHGSYTLSSTPNTVTTIAIPTGALGFRLISKTTSADILFAIDENPVTPGTNSLTVGNTCAYGSPEQRLVLSGAANLNIMSATGSAVVFVEFF